MDWLYIDELKQCRIILLDMVLFFCGYKLKHSIWNTFYKKYRKSFPALCIMEFFQKTIIKMTNEYFTCPSWIRI